MKKNTITKVLLIMVMLLLVFSMFACQDKNKGNDGGSSNKTLATPVLRLKNDTVSWDKVEGAEKYRVIIYDENGDEKETKEIKEKFVQLEEGESVVVIALPKAGSSYQQSSPSEKMAYKAGVAKQLINLINGVQGFIDTWNDVQVNDTLSLELALGGFITSGTGDQKKENSVAVSVLANAAKQNLEFMLDFKLNKKDYVSLGFKNNAIFVREPLNYVNQSGVEAPNAFKIDASALSACVTPMMTAAMTLISIEDIEFDELFEKAKTFLGGGLVASVIGILEYDEEDGKKIISVTIKTLKQALDLVGGMPEVKNIFAKIDGYIEKYYEVSDALGLDPIMLNGEKITWDKIISNITSAPEKGKLINIEVAFEGKNVKSLNLNIDLGALALEGIDNTIGLEINPFSLSKEKTANINVSGFTAQNLEIDLGAALGVKDLAADAKATIRLADAFANKNNKWATLTVTDKTNTASAYIDATGAYADFGPVFTMLGAAPGETIKTKYDAKFKNDQNENINLVDTINTSVVETFSTTVMAKIAEIRAAKEAEKNKGKEDETGNTDNGNTGDNTDENSGNEGGFDFVAYVTDIAKEFGKAQDKIDFVCGVVYPFIEKVDSAATAFLPDVAENKKGTATQATVIKYAFERELADTNSSVSDYALFYKDGENKPATTFKGLWDNIKACHEAGKDALDAATKTSDNTAGVQFFDPATAENDLLDYVAHFVKVPSIEEGEPDFETLVAINDADNLKDWLNWIFPVDNEYRVMVEDILGIELEAIIDGGLYFEAINLGGFNGAIRIASGSDVEAEGYKSYVYMNAGFGMKASVADSMAAIEAEVAFNAQNEGEYYIAEMADALLTALRAY